MENIRNYCVHVFLADNNTSKILSKRWSAPLKCIFVHQNDIFITQPHVFKLEAVRRTATQKSCDVYCTNYHSEYSHHLILQLGYLTNCLELCLLQLSLQKMSCQHLTNISYGYLAHLRCVGHSQWLKHKTNKPSDWPTCWEVLAVSPG